MRRLNCVSELSELEASCLSFLDMNDVLMQYQRRSTVSKKLKSLLKRGKAEDFTDLALGISNTDGNYSAAEHGLGPKILAARPASAVFELAKRLAICPSRNKWLIRFTVPESQT